MQSKLKKNTPKYTKINIRNFVEICVFFTKLRNHNNIIIVMVTFL